MNRTDPAGTEYRFDVTSFVLWALGANNSFSNFATQDSDGTITFMLQWNSTIGGGGGAYKFESKETSSSLAPRLEVVTAVPEPASLSLLASAVFCLMFGARTARQRRQARRRQLSTDVNAFRLVRCTARLPSASSAPLKTPLLKITLFDHSHDSPKSRQNPQIVLDGRILNVQNCSK